MSKLTHVVLLLLLVDHNFVSWALNILSAFTANRLRFRRLSYNIFLGNDSNSE